MVFCLINTSIIFHNSNGTTAVIDQSFLNRNNRRPPRMRYTTVDANGSRETIPK